MEFGMPIGAGQVSDHRQSSAAERISCTQGNSVADKVVAGVRGVLSLDDRTECGENAHTTGESEIEFGTRKGVLCPPRRPKYNHSRKGALIQRDQDKMPYQGTNRDADQGLYPGLVAGVVLGLDQGLYPGLVRAQAYHGCGSIAVAKRKRFWIPRDRFRKS